MNRTFYRLFLAVTACVLQSWRDPGVLRSQSPPSPVIESITPVPGSAVAELLVVEVAFEVPVSGVDASDLLVGGAPASTVFEPVQGHFVFTFPEPAPGNIVVAWSAGHGITDLNGAHFVAGSWNYTLDPSLARAQVRISEFLAENQGSLRDEDGDDSDWVEIQNAGATPVNLQGWALTDEMGKAKWLFPNFELAPEAFLIVFASGKNRVAPEGKFHTNFKLDPEGEYLGLLAPDRTPISEFSPSFPKQRPDVSYGRVPGQQEALGYFPTPTPGKANSSGGPGFAGEVRFSQQSGTFSSLLTLRLTVAPLDAMIRYTLDGSMPTNSSPVYTAPLEIKDTTQVRARAYQPGLLPGPPQSETYILLNTNLAPFLSDLPVLVMHTVTRGALTESRNAFVHFSVYEPVNGAASLTNKPAFASRGAAKVRGSSTAGISKASFAVEWWDEFNQDKSMEILGMPAESEWVLYAPNQFDPVLIHNPFIHQLSRDMGRYSPRTRFVEVYLNRTGGALGTNHYNGIYVLEEKISIGKNRVDIDKLEPEHAVQPEISGGYLMKIDRLDPGDSGFSAGGAQLAYVDPKEREMRQPQRAAQKKYLTDYFAAFGKALSGTNWLDPKQGYAPFIDTQAWVDYHILEVVSGNVDSLVLSCYLHKPRNGGITFGPHWDFDRALGSTDGRDANPRMWSTGPFFGGAWWNKILRDKDFWQRWVDRYQEYRTNHLSGTNMNRLIDSQANEVRQAQPRERRKWNVSPRGGSYQGEVNLMKNWLSNRLDFIDKQMARPPLFASSPGLVAKGFHLQLSVPAIPTNSTIYYTLDGSDPRLPQGEISPSALRYAGPILIEQNARVVARAHNPSVRQTGGPLSSTPWSASVAGTFVVEKTTLNFSEIMLRPAMDASGNGLKPSDYEFIELKNFGPASVLLAGVRIRGDAEFTFQDNSEIKELGPGGRLLLVKNRLAFTSRYPNVTNIAGEFIGSLPSGDVHVTLTGPLHDLLAQIHLRNAIPPLANGAGFSLVPINENDQDLLEGWRSSSRPQGSPGQPDPQPGRVFPSLINEILSHPVPPNRDAVELYNPSSQAIDVSGWFLSDDLANPKKHRIASGSWIAPKGFLVIEPNPGAKTQSGSFGIAAAGDSIHLFSADGLGELTGWHHGGAIGPVESGTSVGRHVTSDGNEHFVAESRETLGSSNAGPKIGPVVFSEIHYRPGGGGNLAGHEGEFIELHNPSKQTAYLFHPGRPSLAWKIRGAVDYDFQPGDSIPPEGFLILRGPATPGKPDDLQPSLQRFASGHAVRVAGPWKGHLGAASGNLRLSRPAETSPIVRDSDTPYLVVESVNYSSAPPWPTEAYGTGNSLTRKDRAAFADDPGNWISAPPTPGDVDSDHDGLPDRWEIARGMNPLSPRGDDGASGDPDGDGLTNLQEFDMGTSPLDRLNLLRLQMDTNPTGGWFLRFNPPPNAGFTVESTTTLPAQAWEQVLTSPQSSAAGGVTLSIPVSAETRFYRVRSP